MALARPAAADETAECISASESAQQLRDDHALLQAREKLFICARPVCPGAIRRDCIDLGAQVEAAIPTIVLRARDPRGIDVVDVKVSCDGTVLGNKLDGKAFRIDPGAHAFRFEAPGLPITSRTIVLGEGEKNRLEVVQLAGPDVPHTTLGAASTAGKAAPSGPRPDGAEAAPTEPAPAERRPLPVAAIVAGGAGVVALVPMAILWAGGTSDIQQMRTTCAPSAGGAGCSASRVDSAHTKLVVGDVFLGVGLAGLATGAALFLFGRGAGPGDAPVRVDAAVLPSGAYLTTEGRF
jgi:hypothetical protein